MKKPAEFLTAGSFEKLANGSSRNPTDWFRSFVALAACALSMGAREAEYLTEASRWKPAELVQMSEAFGQLVITAERQSHLDVLGPIHMELGSVRDKAHNGEFYTPREVCRMMAQVTLSGEFPDHRPITIMEPACGSGGMVLAAVEEFANRGVRPFDLRVTCIDVSKLACDMCFINLALHGVPAVIIHGNALSLEEWGTWATPWWHSRYRCAAYIAQIDDSPPAPPQLAPMPTIEEVAVATETGQFAFSFGGGA